MKKFLYIFMSVILTGGFGLRAQPYIGRHAKDVEQYIRSHHREFSLDQTTRNDTYKYLKFVDRMGYKTLLVFLSEQDTVTYFKIVYDIDLYDKVREELDTCCTRENDTSWIEVIGRDQYRKVMKKEDWFFSVVTRPVGDKHNR